MEKNNQNNSFDLGRKLTKYEMENFDAFMKPSNTSNTSKSAMEVNIKESVDRNIEKLDDYLTGNFD